MIYKQGYTIFLFAGRCSISRNVRSDLALYIKNPRVDQLAREVSEATGENITQAVLTSLEERLVRIEGRRRGVSLEEEIMAIRTRCKALPILNRDDAAHVMGYDDLGVPR